MNTQQPYSQNQYIGIRQTIAVSQKPRMVAESLLMQTVASRLSMVAQVKFFPLLLTGETGVGKQQAALFVHEVSKCVQGTRNPQSLIPFVDVNCVGLPQSLLETELFGYEAGSFTDAKKRKLGQLELASGGSLFLDEIGYASLDVQRRLLKFLDGHEFRRVGGTVTISIKTRVIASTNCDLTAAIEKGSFEKDLFYRLNAYHVHIPPLRERKEEIEPLIRNCIERFNQEYETCVSLEVPGSVVAELSKREWPGNVRELFNVVQRAIINRGCKGQLEVSDFDFDDEADIPEVAESPNKKSLKIGDSEKNISKIGDNLTLEELERLHILSLLKRYHYNVDMVSKILGGKPRWLYGRLRKLGLNMRKLRMVTPDVN